MAHRLLDAFARCAPLAGSRLAHSLGTIATPAACPRLLRRSSPPTSAPPAIDPSAAASAGPLTRLTLARFGELTLLTYRSAAPRPPGAHRVNLGRWSAPTGRQRQLTSPFGAMSKKGGPRDRRRGALRLRRHRPRPQRRTHCTSAIRPVPGTPSVPSLHGWTADERRRISEGHSLRHSESVSDCESDLGSTTRCCGLRWHRQTTSVSVCSPSSRRLATLGPASRG